MPVGLAEEFLAQADIVNVVRCCTLDLAGFAQRLAFESIGVNIGRRQPSSVEFFVKRKARVICASSVSWSLSSARCSNSSWVRC